MKHSKINVMNFGRALGRSEMKKIMAGSDGGCISKNRSCSNTTTPCCYCLGCFQGTCQDNCA